MTFHDEFADIFGLTLAVSFAAKKLCGYDPQRLLTYQPMSVSRWASENSDPLSALQAFAKEMMGMTYPNVMTGLFPTNKPPTRYEIEGGHFFMQDAGTVNIDDEMIDFGSPTGRRLAPFVMPIGRMSFPHLRRPEHKVAVINVDMSNIEATILATMADKRVRCILIDIDRASGDMPGVLDYSSMLKDVMTKPPAFDKPKKVKQNGRPADYLDRDPTKKHKGYRK